MVKRFELKVSELRSICDPTVFKFKNTSEIKPLDEVIGQQRAVQAIEFGLNMKDRSYNLFVTGLAGTGKSTIVRDLVTKHAKKQPTPVEWCLVNNFKDVYRPNAIAVSPGKALPFYKKMNKVIEDLKKDLPKALEGEAYLQQLSKIKNEYTEESSELFHELEEYAADRSLQIEQTDAEFQVVPVVNGKPITPEEFANLTEDQRLAIEENMRIVQSEIDAKAREIDKIEQALHTDIEKLLDKVALSVVQARLDSLKAEFKDNSDILDYLAAVQEDIVDNFNIFIPSDKSETQPENLAERMQKPNFHQYQVNVLVDRETTKGAPVIFESNPTYYNVFGRIEKRAYMGTISTDFTMIQPGSLLNANGGYLIMEIEPVLMNPFVWDALKRALRTKYLQIEDIAEETGFGTTSLKPQPIPLDVKVILLGSYEAFEELQNEDPQFNKTFKVRADFDYEVEKTPETIQQYARFIARVSEEENLLPFTSKAVAAIVEYGVKHVADKNKLSIRFGPLHGVLKEADYWAKKNNARVVAEKYVIKAFNEHRFRYNLYEQKIHESYLNDQIIIDVDGEVVGQVNALAVYQIGEFSFGRPARITAETYMGKQGVINIEREAKLSGSTHDKGVLILSGYMGRTFAQYHPLSLSISITFEQNYGGIDGDSASSTELYAILSSLSDIPIRQGIAVTGSVNQKGQIQAIGDVNQKIEGFFEVCKEKGLTGQQGVIIPKANVDNLMIKREVINDVKRKKFHIYQVSTVEEGIEILTGVAAGKPDKNGNFPKGTVYGAVQQKLKTYFERSLLRRREIAETEDQR
ncbi:MAG: AAA family ATPase [Desulfobacterales bacterium]|nr:MAG: AAA family ATPase [Desulfobacterales bacterium]